MDQVIARLLPKIDEKTGEELPSDKGKTFCVVDGIVMNDGETAKLIAKKRRKPIHIYMQITT
jgi:hypothetical protein